MQGLLGGILNRLCGGFLFVDNELSHAFFGALKHFNVICADQEMCSFGSGELPRALTFGHFEHMVHIAQVHAKVVRNFYHQAFATLRVLQLFNFRQ